MIRKLSIFFLGPLVAASLIWPVPALTATVPEVVPGKGLVVFYRLRRMTGAAITFSVDHVDGTLGMLRNGSMLYKYCQPGQHTFYSQVLSGDSVTINVEPGKAYFVQSVARMGVAVARPGFTHVDEATGRAAVTGL